MGSRTLVAAAQPAGSLMGKFIIFAGLLLVVLGAVVAAIEHLAGSRGGLLPGDIVIRRGGFTFYFPIVTCIVASVLLTLLLSFLAGLRR